MRCIPGSLDSRRACKAAYLRTANRSRVPGPTCLRHATRTLQRAQTWTATQNGVLRVRTSPTIAASSSQLPIVPSEPGKVAIIRKRGIHGGVLLIEWRLVESQFVVGNREILGGTVGWWEIAIFLCFLRHDRTELLHVLGLQGEVPLNRILKVREDARGIELISYTMPP